MILTKEKKQIILEFIESLDGLAVDKIHLSTCYILLKNHDGSIGKFNEKIKKEADKRR